MMADRTERLERAIAASGILVVAGLLLTNAAELNSHLAEVLEFRLYVVVGVLLILLVWGLVAASIYILQGVAPPPRVNLTDKAVNRVAEATEEAEAESTDGRMIWEDE